MKINRFMPGSCRRRRRSTERQNTCRFHGLPVRILSHRVRVSSGKFTLYTALDLESPSTHRRAGTEESARRELHGTGKNISGVSIVTPRERNDSAFRQEKCRPGIFLLLFLSSFSSSFSFSYFPPPPLSNPPLRSSSCLSVVREGDTHNAGRKRDKKKKRGKRGENKMGRSKWKKRKKRRGGGWGRSLKEEEAMLEREETRGRETRRPSSCFTRGDSRDVFTRAYVFIAAGTLSAAFKKRTPGLTARGEGNERISLELDDPRGSTNLCLFISMGNGKF